MCYLCPCPCFCPCPCLLPLHGIAWSGKLIAVHGQRWVTTGWVTTGCGMQHAGQARVLAAVAGVTQRGTTGLSPPYPLSVRLSRLGRREHGSTGAREEAVPHNTRCQDQRWCLPAATGYTTDGGVPPGSHGSHGSWALAANGEQTLYNQVWRSLHKLIQISALSRMYAIYLYIYIYYICFIYSIIKH